MLNVFLHKFCKWFYVNCCYWIEGSEWKILLKYFENIKEKNEIKQMCSLPVINTTKPNS